MAKRKLGDKPEIAHRRSASYVSGSEKTYAAKNDDQPFYSRSRKAGKAPSNRAPKHK